MGVTVGLSKKSRIIREKKFWLRLKMKKGIEKVSWLQQTLFLKNMTKEGKLEGFCL